MREKIGVSDENPPEGAIAHIAGVGPNGGWRVIEVWESKDAQEKFTREKLAPVFAEVGIERPEPQQWDVHRVMTR